MVMGSGRNDRTKRENKFVICSISYALYFVTLLFFISFLHYYTFVYYQYNTDIHSDYKLIHDKQHLYMMLVCNLKITSAHIG
eukprot:UN08268